MKKFDVYLIGVGGQGIGLLSEALMRAADHAGHSVRGVDTHGLAQRGGTVISHVRIGDGAHSPLIQEGSAELVIALERHEALRGLNSYVKDGGTLLYYDSLWQPLATRLGKVEKLDGRVIPDECKARGIREIRVFRENLRDSRMQNVVILSELAKLKLVPSVEMSHYEMALRDLLDGEVLERNLEVLREG